MNTAWYNPERIFNSDFILKDKDKLIFPKTDKRIEISFYSKDEFIIGSNNKNIIMKKMTIFMNIFLKVQIMILK